MTLVLWVSLRRILIISRKFYDAPSPSSVHSPFIYFGPWVHYHHSGAVQAPNGNHFMHNINTRKLVFKIPLFRNILTYKWVLIEDRRDNATACRPENGNCCDIPGRDIHFSIMMACSSLDWFQAGNLIVAKSLPQIWNDRTIEPGMMIYSKSTKLITVAVRTLLSDIIGSKLYTGRRIRVGHPRRCRTQSYREDSESVLLRAAASST